VRPSRVWDNVRCNGRAIVRPSSTPAERASRRSTANWRSNANCNTFRSCRTCRPRRTSSPAPTTSSSTHCSAAASAVRHRSLTWLRSYRLWSRAVFQSPALTFLLVSTNQQSALFSSARCTVRLLSIVIIRPLLDCAGWLTLLQLQLQLQNLYTHASDNKKSWRLRWCITRSSATA